MRGRTAIIVSEIPYQVNKATMVERIAELAREKKIEGISHVQDESDRFGVRVVIELRRDATPDVVLNQLFRLTPLQTSFGCNMLALNGGRPEVLDLKRFLTAFIAFREEVVARRTAFELRKARERAHVLCGLAVAVSNVDEVVATIRASADPAEARERLMRRAWPAADIAPYISLIDDPSHRVREDGTYLLSETQARAILELRLQRLTALGVKEVTDELETLRRWLQGDLHRPSNEEDWPKLTDKSEAAWAEAKKRLRQSNDALRDVAMTLDESRLEQPLGDGMSKVYVALHGIIQHNIYHAGQISMLKKMKS